MKTSMRVLGFTLLGCLMCGAIAVGSATSRLPSYSYSLSDYQRALEKITGALRPVLKGGTTGVRLSYAATCTADTNLPPIPPLILDEPPQSSLGLSAGQQVFRHDQEVKVTGSARGIFRIRIGDVPEKLVMTRIRELKLRPRGQYNSDLIIAALENSTEMGHAMDALHMLPLSVLYLYQTQAPEPGIRHFSSVSRDMTVDEVLDELAVVFKGVVVCGVCTDGPTPRRFYISFAYVI
jgi:hypothetical protein